MTWYALLDESDNLVGVTEFVDAERTPYEVVILGATNPAEGDEWSDPVAGETKRLGAVWNPATRSFVNNLPPAVADRLQDLVDDPGLVDVWQRLTIPQRTVLRQRLIALLGRRRWRYATDPVDLPEEAV